MAASDPHFRLRIPEDLHNRLTFEAANNGRSINAEIIYRLKMSFGLEVSPKDIVKRRMISLHADYASVTNNLNRLHAERDAIERMIVEAAEDLSKMKDEEE